ncbi:MAG: NADPH-dependent FMN reductase, partial [Hyphomicrobiaceae bacterium]
SDPIKILIFAGSARKGALSKMLANAARLAVEDAGANPTLIDMKDFDAPVYNGDIEDAAGVPATILCFNELVRDHDALMVVTPEYNGFFPPLLKNTFDWSSRPDGHESGVHAMKHKVIGLLSTSPGPLGGIRALPRLGECVTELQCIVAPGSVAVPRAGDAFADDGRLKDEMRAGQLAGLVKNVLSLAAGWRG